MALVIGPGAGFVFQYQELAVSPLVHSIGCSTWIDWNLYGHQLVTHFASKSYKGSGEDAAEACRVHDVCVRASRRQPGSQLSFFDCVTRPCVGADYFNSVDKDMVPVPHFGVCMTVDEFDALAARLKAAGVTFLVEPHLRFPGKAGEQWTMFFKDPAGNNLEFKAMTK